MPLKIIKNYSQSIYKNRSSSGILKNTWLATYYVLMQVVLKISSNWWFFQLISKNKSIPFNKGKLYFLKESNIVKFPNSKKNMKMFIMYGYLMGPAWRNCSFLSGTKIQPTHFGASVDHKVSYLWNTYFLRKCHVFKIRDLQKVQVQSCY